MDTCLIRVIGDDFIPTLIVAKLTLVPYSTFRKGELRPGSKRPYTSGGMGFEIGSGTLQEQIGLATEFLIRNKDELKGIASIPSVENFFLEFSSECALGSIDSRSPESIAIQRDYIPIELIRLAADVGLGVCICLTYPSVDTAP